MRMFVQNVSSVGWYTSSVLHSIDIILYNTPRCLLAKKWRPTTTSFLT